MENNKKKLILASGSPRRREILENNGYDIEIIKSFGEMNIIGKEYSRKLVCECARVKAAESYGIYTNELYNTVIKQYKKTFTATFGNTEIKMSYKNVIKKWFDNDIDKYYNYLLENMVIVSADTVVANCGIIYGKPKDRLDAIQMIKSLSGKTHIVCTALCIGLYVEDAENIVKNGKNIRLDSEDKERFVFTTKSEETEVTFRELSDEEIEKYVDDFKPYDKAGGYGIQDEGFSFVEKINGNIDNVIGFPMESFNILLDTYGIEF